MSNKIVCLCNFVSEKEVIKALQKGAISIQDLENLTGAASSCGRCRPVLQQMLHTHLASCADQQKQLF